MTDIVLLGLLIPFLGTTAGAACVFLTGERMHPYLQKGLLGFASGVMVAASVWSLIIPAMDMSAELVIWPFFHLPLEWLAACCFYG